MVSVDITIRSYTHYDLGLAREATKTVNCEGILGSIEAYLAFCEEAWKAYHGNASETQMDSH